MALLVRKAPLLLTSALWLVVQCLAKPDASGASNLPSLVIKKQQQEDSPASGIEEVQKVKPHSRVVLLRAGAPATSVFDALSLQLLEVFDSRCPTGVECITAGEVSASLSVVEDGTYTNSVTVSSNPLTPNVSTPVLGFVLELRDVKPYPTAGYQGSPATDKGKGKPAYLVTVVVTEPSEARLDLYRAKLRWAAATEGMDGYTMVQRLSCFCLDDLTRPVTLTVDEGDKLVSGVYVDDQTAVNPDYLGTSFKSVTQLFDLIRDAFEQNAASIQVTYDAQLGYPASIFIDYDVNLADEEASYAITSLEITRA